MYFIKLNRLSGLLLLTFLINGYQTACAEPKTGDNSFALKKMQGMIRQLNQDKAALEKENASLLTDKSAQDTTRAGLEQTIKKLQPLQGEVERYKAGLESVKNTLVAQLSEERLRQQTLLQKHNGVVIKAKAIQADNQLLVQSVQEREQWIEQCSVHNKKMQTVYLDVLSKYQDKGLWQQLAELDPVTGIGKVETETTVEDFKYKLKQLKVTPFQAQTGQTKAVPKTGSEVSGQ
jgi:hypothetical protein